jgi:hypothetical protein
MIFTFKVKLDLVPKGILTNNKVISHAQAVVPPPRKCNEIWVFEKSRRSQKQSKDETLLHVSFLFKNVPIRPIIISRYELHVFCMKIFSISYSNGARSCV